MDWCSFSACSIALSYALVMNASRPVGPQGLRSYALSAGSGVTPSSGQALAAWLQLSLTPGLRTDTLRDLLRRYGLPESVIGSGRRALSALLPPRCSMPYIPNALAQGVSRAL